MFAKLCVEKISSTVFQGLRKNKSRKKKPDNCQNFTQKERGTHLFKSTLRNSEKSGEQKKKLSLNVTELHLRKSSSEDSLGIYCYAHHSFEPALHLTKDNSLSFAVLTENSASYVIILKTKYLPIVLY